MTEMNEPNKKALDEAQKTVNQKLVGDLQKCYDSSQKDAEKYFACGEKTQSTINKCLEKFKLKLEFIKMDFVDCTVVKKKGKDECLQEAQTTTKKFMEELNKSLLT